MSSTIVKRELKAGTRPLAIIFAIIATFSLSAAVSFASSFSLQAGVLAAGLIAATAMLMAGDRAIPFFLAVLGALLAGYAFGGRGFAYIGAPPVFLGELVLGVAALVLLIRLSHARLIPLDTILIVFMAWGAVLTVHGFTTYGFDALRDAVAWSYALFAIALSVALSRYHLDAITSTFARVAPLYVAWVPLLFVLHNNFSANLPVVPGTTVTLPFFQPDAVGVHLAAVGGFVILGLQAPHTRMRPLPFIGLSLIWMMGLIICGSISRGAFLGAAAAVGLALALRPNRLVLPAATAAAIALLVLMAINPTFDVAGKDRNVSVQQLVANTLTIFGGSAGTDEARDLAGTKSWRLEWWGDIVNYTFFGSHFWTGKGFGVNLADEDGFQLFPDHSLRSPHNTHLTILARMGVPGFTIWVALNLLFVSALWVERRWAVSTGDDFRAAFIGFTLVYWLAMTVNGGFTLYLESPHQGIWYWTVFGTGLAVIKGRRRPESVHGFVPEPGYLAPPPRRLLPNEVSRSTGNEGAPLGLESPMRLSR